MSSHGHRTDIVRIWKCGNMFMINPVSETFAINTKGVTKLYKVEITQAPTTNNVEL